MRRRFSLDERAALEGLPLYLIIMVVVAGVVIVILLAWLSSVNHASIGSTGATFFGQDSAAQIVFGCTPAHSTDPLCATYIPSTLSCIFQVNPSWKSTSSNSKLYPFSVTVLDTKGNPMTGVTVTLTPPEGFTFALGLTEVTGNGGVANFGGLGTFTGNISANTASGVVHFTAQATSGTSTSGQASLALNAPNTC